jgi:hypothetical protein
VKALEFKYSTAVRTKCNFSETLAWFYLPIEEGGLYVLIEGIG